MAMTMKAAGIGYHKSANLATATPCLGFIEVSKSDHVTFGGNQMSSFQNHSEILLKTHILNFNDEMNIQSAPIFK